MTSRKLAKSKAPKPAKVSVRIQSFTLEAETADARGRVRMVRIEGENLNMATLDGLLREIASAARGGK